MYRVAGNVVLALLRHTLGQCFGGAGTRACRRAVARRRTELVAGLRAVEVSPSLSQLAGNEVGAYLHRGSALRARPGGHING
jgi:hypothetical protein